MAQPGSSKRHSNKPIYYPLYSINFVVEGIENYLRKNEECIPAPIVRKVLPDDDIRNLAHIFCIIPYYFRYILEIYTKGHHTLTTLELTEHNTFVTYESHIYIYLYTHFILVSRLPKCMSFI